MNLKKRSFLWYVLKNRISQDMECMKHKHYFIIVATAAMVGQLLAIDNPHFYRATNLLFEPRIEHDHLTTFNATLGGGKTSKGRSKHNELVPLFDIYGTQSLQQLSLNTIFNNPNDPFDKLLLDLAQLPHRCQFATISINGHFKIIEANLSLTHNLSHGLFLFSHIPIRRLTVKDIAFTDLSPDDTIFPNKNTPAWQAVFQNIYPLLGHYNIDAHQTTSTGVGDFSCLLGWTHNYQETQVLDFIDFTCMAGFLAPTGKRRNENQLFSLPTGYNGHWAIPLCTTASIGFYEWVTIGAYLNTLFFIDKNDTVRIKTDNEQRGIIKLGYASVADHRGPLIHTGCYFKADHVGHGVSVTAAYSFATQQKSHLTQQLPAEFNAHTINSDTMLKGWNMHTLNFLAEYDCAQEGAKVGNRIGLFYNVQIAGSRVFDTNIFGGTYGIDISWYM